MRAILTVARLGVAIFRTHGGRLNVHNLEGSSLFVAIQLPLSR
ncbi:hypothetical protein [Xylella taiwanensis]|uniref:Histidine kinase n=1 Tax=Xylella taiwanensis TaxID=1444770 RepID=Z9JKI8_9GAMM|nr:hypothetical protein [Xylella taiwanensis]EWS78346.1 hypothetical protein AF72_06310 [Xylella taiwanensis]